MLPPLALSSACDQHTRATDDPPGRRGVWRGTIYHKSWVLAPADVRTIQGWPALLEAAFPSKTSKSRKFAMEFAALQNQEPAVAHAAVVPGKIDFYMFELVS